MGKSASCPNKICDYLGEISLHLTESESSDSDDVDDQIKRPKIEKDDPTSKLNKLIRNFNNLQPTRQYHLGLNFTTSDLFKALSKCLARDYPQVEALKDESEPLEDALFIPPTFIPQNPLLIEADKSILKSSMKTHPDIAQDYNLGMVDSAFGDHMEKIIYDSLVQFYQQVKQTVLVIKGIDLIKISNHRKSRSNFREVDFLVVNHTVGYILKIEVKKTYHHGKPETMKKLKQQLKEQNEFIRDWFGTYCSAGWRYVSVFFAQTLKDFTPDQSCECMKYFAVGKIQFIEVLQELHEVFNANNTILPVEEFKTMMKLLLYCSSNSILPFGKTYFYKLEGAVEKQGSLNNIKTWCFPTPEQKQILDKNHVYFYATWGTGKTLLMTWKSLELAKLKEKVLFLVFNDMERETLLYFDLQRKFENHDNIKVAMFSRYSETNGGFLVKNKYLSMEEITSGYKHIMIDELRISILDGSPRAKMSKQDILKGLSGKSTIWLSFSCDEYWVHEDDKFSENFIGDHLSTFESAKLTLPLRCPGNVLEAVKQEQSNPVGSFNAFLLKRAKIPSTLVEGSIIEVDNAEMKSLSEIFSRNDCHQIIQNASNGLIIVPAVSAKIMSEIKCDCKHIIYQLLLKPLFEKIFDRTLVFWFTDSYSDQQCDPKTLVKDRVRNCFFVSDVWAAMGFEATAVILLNKINATKCRSAAHVIDVPDYFSDFTLAPLIFEINKNTHKCGNELSIPSPRVFLDLILGKLGLTFLKLRECKGIPSAMIIPLYGAIFDCVSNDISFRRTYESEESLFAAIIDNSEELKSSKLKLYGRMVEVTVKSILEERGRSIMGDNLLMNSICKFLKRRIVIHSILQNQDPIQFGKEFHNDTYNIFKYDMNGVGGFAVSTTIKQ